MASSDPQQLLHTSVETDFEVPKEGYFVNAAHVYDVIGDINKLEPLPLRRAPARDKPVRTSLDPVGGSRCEEASKKVLHLPLRRLVDLEQSTRHAKP